MAIQLFVEDLMAQILMSNVFSMKEELTSGKR